MHSFKIRGLALAAFVASGALLAACSGGSKSSMPSVQQQSSASTVTTTLKIVIGGANTQSASRHGQTISATNSKSIVIKYVGDGTPSSPPTNPFVVPPTAPTAPGTPVNLSANPGGNCVVVGTSLACTITGVSFPVGVEDIYVLDYDGTNGTGNLIYASVSTVQVNANGTFSAPGTTAPVVFLNALNGNTAVAGASITFGGGPITIAPISNVVATGSPTSPYFVSAALNINAFDENNQPINGPIPAVVVTDNDTTGNTCLIYIKVGGSLGTTTCTFPAAGTKSTVTITNTNDKVYVQYNNAPFSAVNGLTLTAPVPAPSASPAVATAKIAFQPMSFSASTIGAGTTGAIAAFGSQVFVATGSTTANQAILAYTFSGSTGKLTASSTVVPTPGLTAPIGALAVGPDNNIWFVTFDGHYGVFALTQAAGAVALGQVGVSVATPGSTPLGILSYSGYVWYFDLSRHLLRIDPTQGVSGTNVVVSNPITIPSGSGLWPFAGMVQNGGSFYFTTTGASFVKMVPSTSTSATAANLVPSTSIAESLVIPGTPYAGILLGSDGNYWSVQGGTSNSQFRYLNPSSLIVSSIAAFDYSPPGGGNLTIWGGVAQGGPDSIIATTSSGTPALPGAVGAALSWTTLNNSSSGYVGEGAPGTCVSGGLPWSGQAILTMGQYFVHTSSAGVCVAVP